MIFVLTGCNKEEMEEKVSNKIASISVPFEWFKGSPEDIEKLEPINVEGLNVAKEPVDLSDMNAFKTKLSEIEEILKDKEKFQLIASGEKSLMNVLGSGHISFYTQDDVDGISETLEDFGSEAHQWISGLTLRKFGVRLDSSGKKSNYAIIDINAINDTEDFRIQTLEILLDDAGAILSSVRVGEPKDNPHTNTPLTENSLLYEDTHEEFNQSFKKVIEVLTNQALFEDLENDKENDIDVIMHSVIKKLGVDEKNTKTVLELLMQSKGELKRWGITGYLFDDKNVTGMTLYELIVSDEEGYHFYTIHYKRGTNQITNIEKGSPFKEVYR